MPLDRIPWRDHLAALKWDQGDHIMVAAPTKSGKTTLAKDLVERRSHVITFATKPRDATLDTEYRDWTVISHPREIRPWMDRIIVRPKVNAKKVGDVMAATRAAHREIFPQVFDFVYREGGYCVLIDETLYMADPKYGGVGSQIEMMHYHGRSNGISMVTLTQRPAWIPKIIYSSASHAYIAKTRDSADLRRLGDLGNVDPKQLMQDVQSLPTRWDFVYTPSLGEGNPGIINTRK